MLSCNACRATGSTSAPARRAGAEAGVFYGIGALIGFSSAGVFADLIVWSVLSAIFAGIFIIGSILMRRPEATA